MTGPSSTRTGTIVRIAAAVAVALGFVACRPGEGDLCRCPGECKNGLVCAQSGAVIDSCVDPGPGEPPGRCIEQDGLADMADDGVETLIGNYHDVGGKRDFAPGTASDPSGDTTVAPTTDATETTAPTSSSDATTSTTDTSTSSGGSGSTTGADATSSGSTTSGG